MSEPAPDSDMLEHLIEQCLNGIITSEGIAQLGCKLAEDVEFQKSFRAACQLHINLETEIRSERAIDRTNDIISQTDSHGGGFATGRLSNQLTPRSTRRISAAFLFSITAAFLFAAVAVWALRRPAPESTVAGAPLMQTGQRSTLFPYDLPLRKAAFSRSAI